MPASDKHYKLINSKTGYAIFYHTIDSKLTDDKVKEEQEKVKAQVATQNGLFTETLYWEEIKEEEDGK